jgi:signal transduction histidine kinase
LGKLGVQVSIVSRGVPAGIGLAGAHGAGSYIAVAEEALDRTARLTQRILVFSRHQPHSPRPVRLSELVDGMSELIRHSVDEKIRIETHLNAQWWTRCDVNPMENAILNLAINARDAMPNGGRLVVDTSEEVRERALDPFFTTKLLGKGMGLGLSMTFGYVRQSSGFLRIESRPGEGATVTILMLRIEEVP